MFMKVRNVIQNIGESGIDFNGKVGEQEASVTTMLETPHGDGMQNAAEVILWSN